MTVSGLEKLRKTRTKLDEDRLKCPCCGRTVAKARYGAEVHGIDVTCPRCNAVVELYLPEK